MSNDDRAVAAAVQGLFAGILLCRRQGLDWRGVAEHVNATYVEPIRRAESEGDDE